MRALPWGTSMSNVPSARDFTSFIAGSPVDGVLAST